MWARVGLQQYIFLTLLSLYSYRHALHGLWQVFRHGEITSLSHGMTATADVKVTLLTFQRVSVVFGMEAAQLLSDPLR